MIWAFVLLIAVIAAFIFWRADSVRRGGLQVQKKIDRELLPVKEALDRNEDPQSDMIMAIAARPENRRALWMYLHGSGKGGLFPASYTSHSEVGAAELARWCMHPNEFEQAPLTIVPVASHRVHLVDGWGDYLVYRITFGADHFTKGDVILGVVGPFGDDFPPFSYQTAFSRGDREGSCSSKELVEWYVKINKIEPMRIDDAVPLN